MYAYSVLAKRSAVHSRPWQVAVAVVALAVVMSGQRAQAQPGWVLSHQKISDTQGGFTGILDNFDLFGTSAARGGCKTPAWPGVHPLRYSSVYL